MAQIDKVFEDICFLQEEALDGKDPHQMKRLALFVDEADDMLRSPTEKPDSSANGTRTAVRTVKFEQSLKRLDGRIRFPNRNGKDDCSEMSTTCSACRNKSGGECKERKYPYFGPVVCVSVSATLIPIFVTIAEQHQNQGVPGDFVATKSDDIFMSIAPQLDASDGKGGYFGVENFEPLVDEKTGEEIYLEQTDLTAQNKYFDEKVKKLFRHAADYGKDDPDLPRALILDITTSRVNSSYGGIPSIKDKAWVAQELYRDEKLGDLVVGVYYGKGHDWSDNPDPEVGGFRLGNKTEEYNKNQQIGKFLARLEGGDPCGERSCAGCHPHCHKECTPCKPAPSSGCQDCKWDKGKVCTVNECTDELYLDSDGEPVVKDGKQVTCAEWWCKDTLRPKKQGDPLEKSQCPIALFGYSMMIRGTSFRPDRESKSPRVPSHIVLKMGNGMSIEKLVQAFGRATFTEVPPGAKVHVLARKIDLEVTQQYPKLMRKIHELLKEPDGDGGKKYTLQEIIAPGGPLSDVEEFKVFVETTRSFGYKRQGISTDFLGFKEEVQEGPSAADEEGNSDLPAVKECSEFLTKFYQVDPGHIWAERNHLVEEARKHVEALKDLDDRGIGSVLDYLLDDEKAPDLNREEKQKHLLKIDFEIPTWCTKGEKTKLILQRPQHKRKYWPHAESVGRNASYTDFFRIEIEGEEDLLTPTDFERKFNKGKAASNFRTMIKLELDCGDRADSCSSCLRCQNLPEKLHAHIERQVEFQKKTSAAEGKIKLKFFVVALRHFLNDEELPVTSVYLRPKTTQSTPRVKRDTRFKWVLDYLEQESKSKPDVGISGDTIVGENTQHWKKGNDHAKERANVLRFLGRALIPVGMILRKEDGREPKYWLEVESSPVGGGSRKLFNNKGDALSSSSSDGSDGGGAASVGFHDDDILLSHPNPAVEDNVGVVQRTRPSTAALAAPVSTTAVEPNGARASGGGGAAAAASPTRGGNGKRKASTLNRGDLSDSSDDEDRGGRAGGSVATRSPRNTKQSRDPIVTSSSSEDEGPAPAADAPPGQWQSELQRLTEMGFTDEATLTPLLKKHDGSLQHVITELTKLTPLLRTESRSDDDDPDDTEDGDESD